MQNKKSYIAIVVFVLTAFFNESRAQDTTGSKSDSVAAGIKQSETTADSSRAKKNEQLRRFRKAFQKVVKEKEKEQHAQKIKQKKSVKQDPTLDLGVLVLDQTRTKMGEDFYNLFYQQWNPPKNAGNFTIVITEKPTPGLGSLVTVKLDYNNVFRARLQPQYRYIKAVSKQAVARCEQIVEQQAKVRKQLTGY